MGESALRRQSSLKAYQLRNRASDAERFFIETLYDRDFTGNLERERTLYVHDLRHDILFVGDGFMPYNGAPFVAEGSAEK